MSLPSLLTCADGGLCSYALAGGDGLLEEAIQGATEARAVLSDLVHLLNLRKKDKGTKIVPRA